MNILVTIKAALTSARRFLAKPNVRYWLPNRKVVAGALAGALIALAQALDITGLPAGWSEAAAFAIVSYLVPEYNAPDKDVIFNPEFPV